MDNCLWGYGSEIRIMNERGRKYSDKIYPAESPWQSPEPQSPPFSGKRLDGYTPDAMRSNVTSFDGHPSLVSVCHSPSRSDEEEAENSATTFFSTSSEFCNDTSDVDSSSISARHEFYSFKSVGSSPSDCSSRIHISSNRVGHSVQKGQGGTPRSLNDGQFNQDTMAVLTRSERGHGDPENTDDCGDDLSIFRDQCEKLQKPLDFESNGLIWFPPPPEDEDDDAENNFFTYEDDEDEIGDSGSYCYRNSMASCNFVRPATSRGGSVDPGDYVKVKCIASGSPSERKLIS